MVRKANLRRIGIAFLLAAFLGGVFSVGLTTSAHAEPNPPAAPTADGKPTEPSAAQVGACMALDGAMPLGPDCDSTFANPTNVVTEGAKAVVGGVLGGVFEAFSDLIKDACNKTINFVLHSIVGNPDAPPGKGSDNQLGVAAPNLTANWFQEVFGVSQQIAIVLVLPLLIVAIMYSVIRGSVFLMLRSLLIMLPVSFLGSMAVVQMTRLLLWISDDISTLLLRSMVGQDADTKLGFDNFFGNVVADSTSNLLTIIMAVSMLVAAFVIYFELILRELGVYLAAFFLPIAFSALVWPATSKFARRLAEMLIGLIFSKVAIVAALGLGFAAFGKSDMISSSTQASGGNAPDIMSMLAGCSIFFMAAFSGAKILELAPGGSQALEGHLSRPGNLFNKGHGLNFALGAANGALKWMAARQAPRGKMEKGPEKAASKPTLAKGIKSGGGGTGGGTGGTGGGPGGGGGSTSPSQRGANSMAGKAAAGAVGVGAGAALAGRSRKPDVGGSRGSSSGTGRSGTSGAGKGAGGRGGSSSRLAGRSGRPGGQSGGANGTGGKGGGTGANGGAGGKGAGGGSGSNGSGRSGAGSPRNNGANSMLNRPRPNGGSSVPLAGRPKPGGGGKR